MATYTPQVKVDGRWETNALVFATESEAAAYARDLYSRWTLTTGWQAVESDKPVTATFSREEGLTLLATERQATS